MDSIESNKSMRLHGPLSPAYDVDVFVAVVGADVSCSSSRSSCKSNSAWSTTNGRLGTEDNICKAGKRWKWYRLRRQGSRASKISSLWCWSSNWSVLKFNPSSFKARMNFAVLFSTHKLLGLANRCRNAMDWTDNKIDLIIVLPSNLVKCRMTSMDRHDNDSIDIDRTVPEWEWTDLPLWTRWVWILSILSIRSICHFDTRL